MINKFKGIRYPDFIFIKFITLNNILYKNKFKKKNFKFYFWIFNKYKSTKKNFFFCNFFKNEFSLILPRLTILFKSNQYKYSIEHYIPLFNFIFVKNERFNILLFKHFFKNVFIKNKLKNEHKLLFIKKKMLFFKLNFWY